MRLILPQAAIALLTMLFVRLALVPVASPGDGLLTLQIEALACLLLSVLLCRQREPVSSAVAVVLAMLLIGLADPLTRPFAENLPVLLTLLLLTALSCSMLLAVLSRPALLALLLALAGLPLWAAPLVEWAGNPPLLTALVVGVSPLTVFAVALEFDFLRSEWWYAHSALGSLRYTYPGGEILFAALAVLPGIYAVRHVRPAWPVVRSRIRKEVLS